VKDGKEATPEQTRAFQALLEAARARHKLGEQAITAPADSGPTYRGYRDRDAAVAGSLPDVVSDEDGWARLVELFEKRLKLEGEPLARLKAAKPDFARERLIVVHLPEHRQPGSRSRTIFHGISEEKEGLRVRIEEQAVSGGPASRPEDRPDREQKVQILKLADREKKVVIREERAVSLVP
jgi:hypothetical protein